MSDEQPPPTVPHNEIPKQSDTEPGMPAVEEPMSQAREFAMLVGHMLAPHTKAIDAMRADVSVIRGSVQAMRKELAEIRRSNDQRDDRLDALEEQARDHERRLAALEKTLPPEAA